MIDCRAMRKVELHTHIDCSLIERLIRTNIHLEVCPTCNIQTGIFEDIASHSLAPLREAGVDLGLNTDARATTNGSLSEEYTKVSAAFVWSAKDMKEITRSALDASFAPDGIRVQVQAILGCYEA